MMIKERDLSGKIYPDIMIDLETMGNGSDSAIVSIAAVEFDINTGEMGGSFYSKVSLESCVRAGLKMYPSTVLWWMKQSEEARAEISSGGGMELDEMLAQLAEFMNPSSRTIKNNVNVWANSPRFDLGILQTAYGLFNRPIPWDFRNERDVRTLASYDPASKNSVAFEGTPHNPLHDCIHQIRYCRLIHGPLNSHF